MPKKLIGTEPYQVPRNADLGTNAFQDAESVNITGGVISLSNTSTTGYFQDTAISDTKPSLLLDFANSKTLDPRITYTRASTASYYDGKTTVKAEENLAAYSQDFNNSYWTKIGVTVTSKVAQAPDGSITADLIYPSSTGVWRIVYKYLTAANTTYTTSFYAKAAGMSWFMVNIDNTSGTTAWFNLSTGDVGSKGSSTISSHSITSVGNGWYRCQITFNHSGAGYIMCGVADADGTSTATANGNNGVYIWGAQVEERSSVSSYTPTTSSQITNYIPALQTAASGVARFDNNPTTGESLGLLIEEQRTNLLTYSEQFDNEAWTKTRTSITSNIIIAPDGTLTGDKLFEDTSASTSHVLRTTSQAFTSGTTYTFSFFLKAAERSIAYFQFRSSTFPSNHGVKFNLSTGTIISNDVAWSTPSISNVGNGWWRITATATADKTYTGNDAFYLYTCDSSGATSYTGDGSSGFYIWGAQLEAGAFPTSYIPTTSAQVTRAADSASMTGANFTSWYNPSEGTLFSEADLAVIAGKLSYIAALISETSNNYMSFARISGAYGAGRIVASGVTQSDCSLGVFESGIPRKTAVAYKENSFAASANGGTADTDYSGAIPTVSTLTIGGFSNDPALRMNGHIKRLAYYPKRLSDAELQEMTL